MTKKDYFDELEQEIKEKWEERSLEELNYVYDGFINTDLFYEMCESLGISKDRAASENTNSDN